MERDLDKKLYNDYLSGEKQAFEYLYNKYKSKIEYFIYNIVKDYQKAEDLAQETFIYIMQNKMKSEVSFKYYIYLVAKSKAFNYINVENRRNEIADMYLTNKEQVENDVLDVITQEEMKKELLKSINLLDEKYKNAIYLVNIENLSYKETADILGETLQNTKNLVHRGKKQLRKILLKKGFDEMNKVSKLIIAILCISVLLVGGVYATILTYNFIQSRGKAHYEENMDEWFEINEQEMYYKKIETYEEYLKYKEKWTDMTDISEDELKENFIVLIVATWRMPDINISDITADEDTLFINVDNDINEESIKKEEYLVMGLIPNELNRENIEVKIKEKKIAHTKYVDLKEIPMEYSIEDAIKDGCCVVNDNNMDEDSKNLLENFINSVENNENDELRVVRYEKIDDVNHTTILDLQYDNEIILNIDYTRSNFSNKEIIYVGKFNYIKKQYFLDNKTEIYVENLMEQRVTICIY